MSYCEAEYVALSEAVKEIRFLYTLVESLKISVKLLVIVRIDNVGAILWLKIHLQESIHGTLIRGIILSCNTSRMDSLRFYLSEPAKIMRIFSLRMCVRKFMRIIWWSFNEMGPNIKLCMIGRVVRSVTNIHWFYYLWERYVWNNNLLYFESLKWLKRWSIA